MSKFTCDSSYIYISFIFEGGFGDYLISANYFCYFRNYFLANKIHYDLYGNTAILHIFNYTIDNVDIKLLPKKFIIFKSFNKWYVSKY